MALELLTTDTPLKVCPFCGGKAGLYTDKIPDGYSKYFIRCVSEWGCSMRPQTPTRYDSGMPKELCIQMVTNVWNKRAEDYLPRNSIIFPHPVEPGEPRSSKLGCATCKHRCESVVSKSCRYCEPNSVNSNWEDDLR